MSLVTHLRLQKTSLRQQTCPFSKHHNYWGRTIIVIDTASQSTRVMDGQCNWCWWNNTTVNILMLSTYNKLMDGVAHNYVEYMHIKFLGNQRANVLLGRKFSYDDIGYIFAFLFEVFLKSNKIAALKNCLFCTGIHYWRGFVTRNDRIAQYLIFSPTY